MSHARSYAAVARLVLPSTLHQVIPILYKLIFSDSVDNVVEGLWALANYCKEAPTPACAPYPHFFVLTPTMHPVWHSVVSISNASCP